MSISRPLLAKNKNNLINLGGKLVFHKTYIQCFFPVGDEEEEEIVYAFNPNKSTGFNRISVKKIIEFMLPVVLPT